VWTMPTFFLATSDEGVGLGARAEDTLLSSPTMRAYLVLLKEQGWPHAPDLLLPPATRPAFRFIQQRMDGLSDGI
jgi:hypothetical protein